MMVLTQTHEISYADRNGSAFVISEVRQTRKSYDGKSDILLHKKMYPRQIA